MRARGWRRGAASGTEPSGAASVTERGGGGGEIGRRHFAATLRQLFVSRFFFLFVFICRVCGSAERGVGDDAGRGGSVGSGTQRRKCKAKRVRKRGSDGGRETGSA